MWNRPNRPQKKDKDEKPKDRSVSNKSTKRVGSKSYLESVYDKLKVLKTLTATNIIAKTTTVVNLIVTTVTAKTGIFGATQKMTLTDNEIDVSSGDLAIDLDGNLNIDVSGGSVNISDSSPAGYSPILKMTSTDATAAGPIFWTDHASPSPATGDEIFNHYLFGKDDGGNNTLYVNLTGKCHQATGGDEEGYYHIGVATSGGSQVGLQVIGDNGTVRVNIGYGAASVTAVAGNITVVGTVDGRDVATDGTKLDGIEASADVTDATNVTSAGALMDSELTDLAGVKGVTISTLQAKPSEGGFVNGDKTKLDAIEASADVTDATNVTAAGALMDSEVTNLADVKAFDTSDYATAAQGTLATNALPKAGGTMTGHIAMADNVKAVFGDAGEYIVGNGNDLDVVSSGEMNFSAANADLGITAGRDLNIVTTRDINANIAGNFNIDVDGGEARLTDDSETDNVFTPAHDADIATKKYVDDNVLQTAVVTLSAAQCTALHSTAITLVPAQGAGLVVLVQEVVLFIDRAATQANASCDLFVSYGGTTSLSGSVIKYKRRFMNGVIGDRILTLAPYTGTTGISLTEGDNAKVAVKVDSAITSGCLTSMKCVVTYSVYDNS